MSSASKAFLAERYHIVVKSKVALLQRYFGTSNIRRFLKVALDSHNATKTARLGGFSPNQLLARVPDAVRSRRRQLFTPAASAATYQRFWRQVEKKNDLSPGHYVRLTLQGRTIFTKAAVRGANSEELFRVNRVRPPLFTDNTLKSYYFIKDSNNEPIRGAFRRSELVSVPRHLWPDSPTFKPTVTSVTRAKKNDTSNHHTSKNKRYIVTLAGESAGFFLLFRPLYSLFPPLPLV